METVRTDLIAKGYLWVLFWLSVSDLVSSIAWSLGPVAVLADGSINMGWCRLQSVLIAIAPGWSTAWSACLAYEMYRCVVVPHKDLRGTFARRRFRAYHAGSWSIPIICGLILVAYPGVSPHQVDNLGYCWYDGLGSDSVMAMYLPSIVLDPLRLIVFLFIVAMFGLSLAHLYRVEHLRFGTLRTVRSLMMYPIFFVVVVTPLVIQDLTVDATSRSLGPGQRALELCIAVLSPSQATFNVIVYLATSRAAWRQIAILCGRSHCCGVPAVRPRISDEPLLPSGSDSDSDQAPPSPSPFQGTQRGLVDPFVPIAVGGDRSPSVSDQESVDNSDSDDLEATFGIPDEGGPEGLHLPAGSPTVGGDPDSSVGMLGSAGPALQTPPAPRRDRGGDFLFTSVPAVDHHPVGNDAESLGSSYGEGDWL